MEIRTVKQLKIFKLFLNDMRLNVPELAAISFVEEDLNTWIQSQIIEEYSENEEIKLEDLEEIQMITWKKIFIKGSNLEWLNLDKPYDGKYGIFSQWINEEDFEKFRSEYPFIPVIE